MLEGYTIREELHRGRRHVVHRAVREADGVAVVIKSVATEIPTEIGAAELKREFDILSHLSIDGVVRAYELNSEADNLHLILEDRGGVTLTEHLRSESFDVSARLLIAMDITAVLAELHDNGVLHKDINPANILVDPFSRKITLIDFSISTRDPEEHQAVIHPNVLEGTLAYISPEQTGRMNRPVDYRSDFYSLGATLFELFTQRVPFQASDPMELIHSHMAVPAPSPASFRGELPSSLCMVIQKLLEKAPEDRYQSASGILDDLRTCLSHVQGGGVPAEFVPGERDRRERFSIPRKLYGRREELELLVQAFERIGRHGTELLLISGYSGIGKSALIKAVHGPITERRGYFVSGKFDQLQRTVPYSALVAALGELIVQLLTESDEALAEWSLKLQEALGDNGQLVIDVIPEVVHVIGPQRELSDLRGEEAKNRFRMVFQDFVRVFCRREHPLVIFLDDLQWADPASLTLLEAILTDDETEHLLLIGAYRDNEVDESHPLTGTLEALKSSGSAVTEISLEPLTASDISRLLVDTLHCSRDDVESLRSLVVEKTGGNPFFLREFLKTLYRKKQLEFDQSQNRWVWDIAAIEATNITENVVELMVSRLLELPKATQTHLRLAACIGNEFDLATLGVITKKDTSTVIVDIAPAIEAGLIVIDRGVRHGSKDDISRLRFLHDRVQQAAYSLIDESLRNQAHLKIGQRLLANLDAETLDRRLFEIVDHLNAGRELVTSDVERRHLAEYNLRAARKAISAAAYAAARDYAVAGRACLPESQWRSDYELTRDLHQLEAEAEYLRGDFERSQEIIDVIFLELHTPVELAELHNTLIVQRTLSGQYQDAIQTGRKGLALLGIDLPAEDLERALEHELTRYREAICRREPSELLELPEMTSPEMRIAMQLLANLCPLCYIADPPLCRVVSAKMANISLVHGHTAASAFGYAFFGQMHSSVLHDYDRAYSFGQLAMALADKLEDPIQACRTSHVFCAFINHWSRPLRDFDPINIRGFQAGLQSGEVQFAGYHRYNRALCLFHQGKNLKELLQETEEWVRFGRRTRNQHVTDQIVAVRCVAMDLCGETPEPASFAPADANDKRFLEDLDARGATPALCHYNIIKSQALYLYNRIDEARLCADEALTRLPFISGHMSVAVHNFYESLILIAAAAGEKRQKLVDRVKQNQSRMQIWAASCPENFSHKYLLVDAELARLEGDDWQAAELYDRAITAAGRNGYRQEEALARERAGLFWLARGLRNIAALYLRQAHHGYQLWGASSKALQLAEQHADILATAPASDPRSRSENSIPFFTLVSSSGAALDFAAVMKAARALSGEIDLDRLLRRLLRISVETAGAQSGQLLLKRKDGFYVEVTSTLDNGETRLSHPTPIDSSRELPPTIVNYVTRTKETLTVSDASNDRRFSGDAVIQRLQPRSILCLPIMMRSETFGLLYLEHNLASNAFTPDRVQILQSLAAQAAVSLQNARLYEERKENESELRDALAELQQLKARLEAENLYFREEIELHHKFEEVIGRSASIKKLLHSVEIVAPTDATVLILGETGTGKELVARAIHNLSACKDQALITVNCAALPAGLVESELFGHEKGAFTGAISRKIGRFELADGGTIFLDEIGELPLDLQAKLLRVLQEGQFERIGGSQTMRVNVRVIAATNRDLIKGMQDGTFREDLYYRLSVFPLQIPSLRERESDIPLLVRHFVQKHGAKLAKRVETIPQNHMGALQRYHWPGNVRELENVIERAMILSRGSELQLGDWAASAGAAPAPVGDTTLEDVEREHILKVLKRTNWRLAGEKGAAKILGLKRTTLQGRMRKLEIRRDR